MFNSLKKTLLKYISLIDKTDSKTYMCSFKEDLNNITCKDKMGLWTDTLCLVIFWSYTYTCGLYISFARMFNSLDMPLHWSKPQCDLFQVCIKGYLKWGLVNKLYIKDNSSDWDVEKISAQKLAWSFLWEQ